MSRLSFFVAAQLALASLLLLDLVDMINLGVMIWPVAALGILGSIFIMNEQHSRRSSNG
ncbi:hypothetical protein [Qipengyuania sp. MTN3-11]|uniref:hypothetical protein n=1 Tax=Qipengyuania sp. MTN3-11 TaxID=3056557 RepID=UPI0036F4145D